MFPPVMPNVRLSRAVTGLGDVRSRSPARSALVFGEHFDATVAELFFDVVPVVIRQFIWRVLHEHAEDVFARRGDRAINARGHRDFQNRPFAGPAVFGIVVGTLQILERGADVHRAVMLRANAVARHTREARRFAESKIYFGRCGCVVDSGNGVAKVFGQFFRREKLFER